MHGTIGIDEVGRGPLAGPVVVCSVFAADNLSVPDGVVVRDSKKMSAKQRQKTLAWIRTCPEIKFEIAEVPVETIDLSNILEATMLGMAESFNKLAKTISGNMYDKVFVDGNRAPKLETEKDILTVVGGDNKIMAISLASIIAKEYRDAIMVELDKEFPIYGFAKNVGYGTKQHLEAIKRHGWTPHHRKSFAPVKDMISDNYNQINI